MTGIIIPDGVTEIGDGAFWYCENLTSVTIPNSVISIGANTFSSCDKLASITIPDSITRIGERAFSASGLTSVTIPYGVISIEEGTFSTCNSLRNAIIPYGVTSIGDDAFANCPLTSIIIPDSVKSIGYNAFGYCFSLGDVYYGGTEEQWNDITRVTIDDDNNYLTKATIHYNSDVPISMTTAKIEMTEKENVCTFEVDVVKKYKDCYVYVAMYDENGLLTGFEHVPLETLDSTSISVDKTDKTESAKVFVLSNMLQPIIKTQEFTIE